MIETARARLAPLALYPRPLRTRRVRLLVVPWLFGLPWFRRFDAYAIWHVILLRDRALEREDDLIVHELCHVWQQQHGWVRMWLSYVVLGYAENPYEVEARDAEAQTAMRAGQS